MPLAWDVTSLSGKPGSGGCIDRQQGRRLGQVQEGLHVPDRARQAAATYASSKLWSVVDGPVEAVQLQHDRQRHDGAEQGLLGQPQAAAGGGQVRAVHRRLDRVHRAEDRAGRRRLRPGRRTCRRSRRAPRCRPPTRWAAATTCSRSTRSASTTPSPTSTTRPSASCVRQLYVRQALQSVLDQPGIDKAIYRGYAVPTPGRRRTSRRATSGSPPAQTAEQRPGPVPVQHRQGQVAADQPRLDRCRAA